MSVKEAEFFFDLISFFMKNPNMLLKCLLIKYNLSCTCIYVISKLHYDYIRISQQIFYSKWTLNFVTANECFKEE